MTPVRVLSVLFLLVGCIIAAAGCIGQDKNDKSTENGMISTVTTVSSIQSHSTGNESDNYRITITPVDDKRKGENFTITSVTNLPAGTDVSILVYRSMTLYNKSGCIKQSCAMGIVKVASGENGVNLTSFDVNSSVLVPDEYIISEKAVEENASAVTLMNVIP